MRKNQKKSGHLFEIKAKVFTLDCGHEEPASRCIPSWYADTVAALSVH